MIYNRNDISYDRSITTIYCKSRINSLLFNSAGDILVIGQDKSHPEHEDHSILVKYMRDLNYIGDYYEFPSTFFYFAIAFHPTGNKQLIVAQDNKLTIFDIENI